MSAYIAFDLDALNVARDVGNACGLEEAYVTHGMLRMWSWCFRTKTDSVGVDHVRGFFGTDATPALIAFGFLTPDGETFKVKGADRYLRITEARKKGGQAAKKHLIPGAIHKTAQPKALPKGQPKASPRSAEEQPKTLLGSAWALSPNTEHLTPNTILKATAEPQSDSTAPPMPGTRELSDSILEEFRKTRGVEYRFSKADGVQLAALRKIASDEEILRRWRLGLEAQGWHETSTVAQLFSKWNDLSSSRVRKNSSENDIIGHGEIVATIGVL